MYDKEAELNKFSGDGCQAGTALGGQYSTSGMLDEVKVNLRERVESQLRTARRAISGNYTGGTGVTITGASIAIGQAVGTSEKRRADQLRELSILLERHPEVARILDLLDIVRG